MLQAKCSLAHTHIHLKFFFLFPKRDSGEVAGSKQAEEHEGSQQLPLHSPRRVSEASELLQPWESSGEEALLALCLAVQAAPDPAGSSWQDEGSQCTPSAPGTSWHLGWQTSHAGPSLCQTLQTQRLPGPRSPTPPCTSPAEGAQQPLLPPHITH